MRSRSPHLLYPYGFSILSTAAAILLRWLLGPILGESAAYIQNYPAIMVSAWYGGFGPGLLTTGLTALYIAFFILAPLQSFAISSLADIVSMGMFLLIGIVISGLNESLHRSRRELENRVEERTRDLSVANDILQEEIRERKRAEEALKLTSEEIHDLYNRAPCGYHSLDETGLIIQINDTELQWLGYDREEVVGKIRFTDLLTEQGRQKFGELFPEFKEKGALRDVEYEMVRKDGSTFPVLIHADAVKAEDGTYLYSRSSLFDITDRKKAEGLEEANQYKDEFLAILGHELRSPLGAMVNGLYVIRHRYAEQPELIRICDMMDRQLQQMNRLVDDLRDVSRITRGKLSLDKKRVDLRSVIEQSIEATKPLMDERQHELTVTLPPDACWVEADPHRLAQVFTNLLNNAAKYTDTSGRVSIHVQKNSSHATVRITDTGMGIAPEMLSRIFNLYIQADRALRRSQGGLGIGLALVKGLVTMHEGKITASSDGPGHGSTFEITLPLAQNDRAMTPDKENE